MISSIGGELLALIKKPLGLAVVGILTIIIMIPFVTYLLYANTLASKDSIINQKNNGVVLLDRNGTPFFTFYEAKAKEYVPITKIPVDLQDAVVSSEDKDFYTHKGFSISAIIRSFIENIQQKELAYGGSTITQQLVKNALLSPQKNFLRKYQEVVLASELERRYTKQEILEMYFNTVYFGEGAFGIGEAAKTYFNKEPKDLTLAESAILIGILPAPSALSPISNDPSYAIQRQHIVLQKMVQYGYITQAQADQAESQKLVYADVHEPLNVEATHFALMVKDELIKKYGEQQLAQSGFTVKTTIDLKKQEYAEQVVANQVARLKGDNVSNGAAVAIDPKTGEIIALVGSKDWNNNEFGKVNIITSTRQPGSSFKPIVYAKAFEDRIITPSTILRDEPTTFQGNYKPLDYDKKFRGKVLPRRALSNSLNIPAVDVMSRVGVPTVLDFAQQMGISTLGTDASKYGLSLVLGAGEVKPLELTNAYAVFADGGYKHDPTTILDIKDKQNKDIYTYNPDQGQQVLSEQTAFLISSILSDNNARAEEFGNALTISRPAAVKTGTTENYRDAWTIGYTPSLVVGVWVGNNDGTLMDQIAGSLGAAPIWRSLMENFLAGTPVERFTPPSGITQELVCRDKGLLVKDATSSAYMEYYLTGTEPRAYCNGYAYGSSPTPVSTTPSPSPSQQPTQTPQPNTPTPNPTDTPVPSPTAAPTQPPATPTPIVIPTL